MTLPRDQLFAAQSHHSIIRTVWDGGSVWDDYTGRGITVGVFEGGLFELTHRDLDGNVDWNLLFGSTAVDASAHATSVAGIIAAERNDLGGGDGGVGVAYGATLGAGVAYGTPGALANLGNQQRFDVVNHSWGNGSPYGWSQSSSTYTQHEQTVVDAVTNGRNGLGTVIVALVGNDREGSWLEAPGVFGNANAAGPIAFSRHAITVGAVDQILQDGEWQVGTVARYSNPGANILVSAPTGLTTTDLSGSAGQSTQQGAAGDFRTGFDGTSAATPVVSGVVALMLEANPMLGYRDVKEILALSARHTGGAIGAEYDPNSLDLGGGHPNRRLGHELDEWAVNGAENWNNGGMHFSSDYGFGVVDARAAVRLAETWTETNTQADEARTVDGLDLVNPETIPDFNRWRPANSVYRQTFEVADGISVETISLALGFSHTAMEQLEITLISPEGTRSLLTFGTPGSGQISVSGGWTFNSNEFWGEQSGGTWAVEIRDREAGHVGTFTGGSLSVHGSQASEDDTYFYTDEFALLDGIFDDPSRSALVDEAGLDTINAAAVSGSTTFDLASGEASIGASSSNSFGFNFFTISGIENVITGDGNDRLAGNDGGNDLKAGRGHDELEGRGGNDTLSGGRGDDTLTGGLGDDTYVLTDAFLSAGSLPVYDTVSEAADGGMDTVQVQQDWFRTGYTLGAHIENGVVLGAAAFNLTGNELDNALYGNNAANALTGGEGNDTLSALGGLDTLTGGLGDDAYVLLDAHLVWIDGESFTYVYDTVSEEADGGVDTVQVARDGNGGSYALGDNVENGSVTGTGDFQLPGNALANVLRGNDSANSLDGGAGADSLHGGGGDDTFRIDDAADRVYEDAGGGSDIVWTRVSYALATGQEVETLAAFGGPANIALTGNQLANRLLGDTGNNLLNGGRGADTMAGAGGNDTYVVDALDVIDETAGSGRDTVSVAASYALDGGDEIEVLRASRPGATTAIDLSGNAFGQNVQSNAGANVLGGGGGRDVLAGLGGADSFRFDTALDATNVDSVKDFSVLDDLINLDGAIFAALGAPGVLDAEAFHVGTRAAEADDRIIYNDVNGVLFYDADGRGGAAAVAFARLSPGLTGLSHLDFTVD